MKSSDERIDEELRKALRERFDHFERLPDPSLREKIMAGLGGGASMVQSAVVGTLLVLISLTASIYTISTLRRQQNVAVRSAAPMQNKSSVEAKKPLYAANALGSAHSATSPETAPVHQTAPAPLRLELGREALPATQPSVVSAHRAAVPGTPQRPDQAEVTGYSRPNPAVNWAGTERQYLDERALSQSALQLPRIVDQADSVNVTTRAVAETLEGPSAAGQDIGVLDHQPLALPQYEWNADSIVTPGEPQKRYESALKSHWSFVAAVAPLRTFQILTIMPGNGVLYQNFVLPTKISAGTVGYKFSAGMERKGLQLLMNYGQFRQSYRYEIATSEFEVGPDLAGNYNVIRKGIPQEQNSTVRLLGLSVKKHLVSRSHFLRNYYADAGAEFSREFTSKRNMMWINAGLGKELFAGNNVVMTVGPYLEYSISKLRNPDNPFKIQPYQIGLSVGLKYTKK